MVDPQQVLRDKILADVRTYAEEALRPQEFIPGTSTVPVSGKVLDPADFASLVDSSLDGWLTAGRFTEKFQRALARYVGTRASVFVNSGSSANLVALSALTSPKLAQARAEGPGDEVLTVAWDSPPPSTRSSRTGCKPVVVDVELGTYDAIPDRLREAVGPKTRAIMMAHTLGNPFDLGRRAGAVQGARAVAGRGLVRRARLDVRRQAHRQLRRHRDRELLPGTPHHHGRGRRRLRQVAAGDASRSSRSATGAATATARPGTTTPA